MGPLIRVGDPFPAFVCFRLIGWYFLFPASFASLPPTHLAGSGVLISDLGGNGMVMVLVVDSQAPRGQGHLTLFPAPLSTGMCCVTLAKWCNLSELCVLHGPRAGVGVK